MLKVIGKIYFYTKDESSEARSMDIPTGNITIRVIPKDIGRQVYSPHFNFGDDSLWSGTIIVSNDIDIIKSGIEYEADIFVLFIDDEVFEKKKHLIVIGREYKLQEASRIIGRVILNDYKYINDEDMKVILKKQQNDRNDNRDIDFFK